MNALALSDTNADNIYDCKLCVYKDAKKEGYRPEVEWLGQRFPEGPKYKVLYSATDGAVASIKHISGEYILDESMRWLARPRTRRL